MSDDKTKPGHWPNSNIPRMLLGKTPKERDLPGAAQSDDGQGGYRALKADLVADEAHAKNLAEQQQNANARQVLDEKFGRGGPELAAENRQKQVSVFFATEMSEVRRQRQGLRRPR